MIDSRLRAGLTGRVDKASSAAGKMNRDPSSSRTPFPAKYIYY
jgi:hypothetical protein